MQALLALSPTPGLRPGPDPELSNSPQPASQPSPSPEPRMSWDRGYVRLFSLKLTFAETLLSEVNFRRVTQLVEGQETKSYEEWLKNCGV